MGRGAGVVLADRECSPLTETVAEFRGYSAFVIWRELSARQVYRELSDRSDNIVYIASRRDIANFLSSFF